MTGLIGNRRPVQIVMAIMAVVLVAIATTYALATGRLVRAQVIGDRNLLDVGAVPTGRPDGTRAAMIADVLAATPLGQPVLNALLVERARAARRPMGKADAAMLLRMGWRDDAALRNVAEVYADGSDLPRLMDVFDALLRRGRVGEAVTGVMGGMEAEPQFRPALVDKLAQDPPWRSFFFRVGAKDLSTRDAAERRLRTFQALERTAKPPTELEIAAMLPVLHAQGFGREAFDLWQNQRRRARMPLFARPLTDPYFSRAAALQEGRGVATIYDWMPEFGDGFSVGFGDGALRIEWNGRGVPVFVRQRSSAMPGSYRLAVTADGGNGDMGAIGYRLVCPDASVELRRTGTQGNVTVYTTDGPVPCGFPMLEIFGIAQNLPRDVTVGIRRVTLIRN